MKSQSVGQIGEDYAAKFLTSRGHKIVARNFHSRYGEIDLISFKEEELFFSEVKTRRSITFGLPEESFTQHKRSKILKTIYHFLQEKKIFCSWKLQLIAIELDQNNQLKSLKHFKNPLNE